MVSLPGRYDQYLQSLRAICNIVDERHPSIPQLAEALLEKFDLRSRGAAYQRAGFLRSTGMLIVRDNRFYNSKVTGLWLEGNDSKLLIAHLHRCRRFIGEMLAELRRPRSVERLLSIASDNYGLGWKSVTQINNRRGWLASARLITSDQGRLVTTKAGEELVSQLQLHEPRWAKPAHRGHPNR